MLITRSGHIQLVDFGLSAEEEEDAAEGAAGAAEGAAEEAEAGAEGRRRRVANTAVVGTPDYLAPELVRRGGYGYEVGARSHHARSGCRPSQCDRRAHSRAAEGHRRGPSRP